MSYNTRRTTGGGTGRGAPTTQVNYHQQPSRPSANTTQTRNPGYSTGTQQTGYNSSSQPAYTTQPSYTTQPPLPTSQPKQQPSPAAAQPPLPPQQPPQPKQVTTPLKQEPLTPADTPKMDTSENGEGIVKVPFWKKKPLVKLSNRVKKHRQNARLRRLLNPKNAVAFLNELRPGIVKFVVREDPQWGNIASVEIDGKTFSGHSLSVAKAKLHASEQALKHLLLEQLSKTQSKEDPNKSTESKDDDKEPKEEMDTEDNSEDGAPKPKRARIVHEEDELPWGSLAAFALHKLFAEWQREGTDGPPPQEKYTEEGDEAYFTRRPGGPPEFGYPRRFPPAGPYGRGRGFGPYPPPRGPPPPGFGGPRRPPPPAATFLNNSRPSLGPLLGGNTGPMLPMKKIPDDANQRHPVMLLNQLKPNLKYTESREGEAPHVFFTITVQLEGKEYTGRGRSKKEAKKEAAKAALAPLGIMYQGDQ